MIRCKCLCLTLMLCLFSVPSMAKTTDIVKVQCPDYFEVKSIDVFTDGSILLAGGIGGAENGALLICANAQGKVLWTREHDGNGSRSRLFYRTARFLEDGNIVALRREKNMGDWIMEFLRGDQLIRQIKLKESILDIYPVPGGFLTSTPLGSSVARIAKADLEGSELWDTDWKERLSFHGILTRSDTCVAFGDQHTEKKDGKRTDERGPYSVVLALDDQGKQLWRYSSEELNLETFLSGTLTDDGNVVLVGYRPKESDGFLSDNLGIFIAEYGQGGQVWRKYYHDKGVKLDSEFQKPSIIPCKGGYLCAMPDFEQLNSVKMLLVDREGNALKMWDAPSADVRTISAASLCQLNGKLCLIITGFTKHPGPVDSDALEEADLPIPSAPCATIIQQIVIPD